MFNAVIFLFQVVTSAQVTRNPLAACPYRSSTLSVNGELALQAQRNRAPSMAIDTDMVSELEPSSSDSGVVSRCAVVKPLKLRICQPIFGKKSDSSKRQEKSEPTKAELEPALPKQHKPRDPEREKRRLARKKEKRATLILGLIMGSFIACWLPFFFLYILKAACRRCVIPGSAFAIAFWLGYMNSVLNPVIYTIFNKDFRRAFRRILFKWCLAYLCCYRCVANRILLAQQRAVPGLYNVRWSNHLPCVSISLSPYAYADVISDLI